MRSALVLLALLAPSAAMADFVSVGLFLLPFIGSAGAAFVINYGAYIAFAAVAGYGINRQRRAKQRARDAYNASLRDRLQMLDVVPDAPRTICLGRVRNVEGIRRRWSSGATEDRLTMIVSFAGHEIDGFESFYFNDELLTLDGSGYVQNAPYGRTVPVSQSQGVTLDGAGGAVVVLGSVPIGGSVGASHGNGGTGIDYQEVTLGVSVVGSTVTISGGTPGAAAGVWWQTSTTQSFARIRPYLGTAAQNVGAAIAAEYPGKITATDRFAGVACAVIDLWYDPDIYPQGIPSVSALLRGAKVYDPRADSTVPGGSGSQRLADPATWAFSENPALHAYHYARHANGWAVSGAEIRTADVMAAATACDISTGFTLRKPDTSTSVVTLPRHQSGMVIPTDADPQAMMGELLESMAGKFGWAGGVLRLRAGTMAAPAWALVPSWVAQRLDQDGNPDGGAFVVISNGVDRASKVNRVAGSCIDRDQRYQALPFPARQDSVLIAAEGLYEAEVELQAVTHQAHAQHLSSIMIRESQAALRMEVMCNVSAFGLELFDVGTVTLPRFGMAAKTMEVIGWRWHPAEGVKLRLAEITAEIFTPVAELTGRDPAPDSSLPYPWDVETITGVSVTSGTTGLVDGSIITRTRVQWNPAGSQAILRGGKIEVQYTPMADALPAGDWPSWIEEGDSTSATIPGLLRRNYVFRVRAINSIPVRGAWSQQVMHYVAQSRAPKTFRQDTAPTGDESIDGDTWFETDNGNLQYVRSGGAWVALLVGTGGISAAAATEVYVNTPGSLVTVTQGSTTPDAYNRNTALAEITFTPSGSGSASVFAEGVGSYTTSSLPGVGQYSIQLFGATYDGRREIYIDNLTPSTTVRAGMSSTRRIEVTGGVSYRVGFLAAKLNDADVFTVDNIEMRVEVIKR